jgi:hypothetical protein
MIKGASVTEPIARMAPATHRAGSGAVLGPRMFLHCVICPHLWARPIKGSRS